MIKLYDNVFSDEHLLKIKDTIYSLYANKKLIDEHNDPESIYFVEKSFGLVNVPVTLENIESMKQRVKEDYGDKYEFTHSFARMYFNQAKLRIHVDNPGLDLTGSLTVYTGYDNPWPLNFSKKTFEGKDWEFGTQGRPYKESYDSIIINPNQMAVCKGRKTPHWRDRLKCKPDQFSIHVFYHWKLNV